MDKSSHVKQVSDIEIRITNRPCETLEDSQGR